MITITMDKKYKTRDGRDARILCVDREGKYPVVALVADLSGNELVEVYASDGSNPASSFWNLVEKPVEEYRYARCTNVDNRPVHPDRAMSVTFWSVSRSWDDNLKATFVDNKLVKVEILT